ncbi:MAG: MFS transporter [Desulfobacterales bacterium]|nr:MFS transporter [Desulfobacterales bacterium]
MNAEIRSNPDLGNRRRWLTAVAVNVVHCCSHLNSQGISILYPILREQFSFGYTGIGLLSIVNQAVEGPMQLTFGVITRFVSRIRIMAIGTILAFLGVAGIAVSQNFAQLAISRAVRGLGTSPNHPVGGALMADSFQHAKSRAFAIYQTAGNVGGLIAPIVVGGLLYFLAWRSVVVIVGLPILLGGLLLLTVRGSLIDSDSGRIKKRHQGLGLSEYAVVFRERNAMLVAMVMMVGAAGRGTGSLNSYLAAILVDRFAISPSAAAIFVGAYLFGGLTGPLTMGWVADRTSPRFVLSTTLGFAAVFVLLILVPGTAGPMLFVITFLAGFFIYPRSSLTLSMLVSAIPDDTSVDTLLSIYHTFSAITGPLWLFLTGFLVDRFGLSTALAVMACSYVAGIIILNLIKPDTEKQANAVTI